MKIEDFDIDGLILSVRAAGYGDDLTWAENILPPMSPRDFAGEIIFVICNSGMRFTVARGIFERVTRALRAGIHPRKVFGHDGKAEAIWRIWDDRVSLFKQYENAADKLSFIESLPWIGEITKYHVAKNFGLPYAKPDVHLARLGETFEMSPQALCEVLAIKSKLKVATIDTLLWRAAAVGILDTRTGEIKRAA